VQIAETVSASERRNLIAQSVKEHGKVTMENLRAWFDVSEVTLRRDLEILESQNLCRRIRGGAVPNTGAPLEMMFQEKLLLVPEAKREIAIAASAMVSDGQVVMLSAGTTTTYIARELAYKRELTVVTSSINIAAELANYDHITLIVIGGIVRKGSYATVGHMADQSLTSLNADFSFVGVDGVDIHAGFTTPNLMEAHTDMMMLRSTTNGVIVADSTKFGKIALSPVAKVDDTIVLLTDSHADEEYVSELKARGCRVVLGGGKSKSS